MEQLYINCSTLEDIRVLVFFRCCEYTLESYELILDELNFGKVMINCGWLRSADDSI